MSSKNLIVGLFLGLLMVGGGITSLMLLGEDEREVHPLEGRWYVYDRWNAENDNDTSNDAFWWEFEADNVWYRPDMGCIHKWWTVEDQLILKEDCSIYSENGDDMWLVRTYQYEEVEGILFMDINKHEDEDGVNEISNSTKCMTTIREHLWDGEKTYTDIITSVTMPSFCSGLYELDE